MVSILPLTYIIINFVMTYGKQLIVRYTPGVVNFFLIAHSSALSLGYIMCNLNHDPFHLVVYILRHSRANKIIANNFLLLPNHITNKV